MKIKNYINKIVAIAMLVALVSGFQFNNSEGTMTSLESMIGIEEAYAGPCARAGCIGGPDLCMTVEVAWGFWKRTCYTTVPQQLLTE